MNKNSNFKSVIAAGLLSAFMITSSLAFSTNGVNAAGFTGWLYNGTVWNYYKIGVKATGWINDEGTWYFLKYNGAMQTGWIKVNGLWYFMNRSGAMQTGWIKYGVYWYYLNADGDMAVNTVTPDGYQVGPDGAWDGQPKQPVYNGDAIKHKLYSLGFVDESSQTMSFAVLKQGAGQDVTLEVGVRGVDPTGCDMDLSFSVNNPAMDKIKTILNWILPTRGNDLYTMLNNPAVRTVTFELDGRKVILIVEQTYVNIWFGPTK